MRASHHPRLGVALGDDRLAVVQVPGPHAAGDVDRVEAVRVEPRDGLARAAAGAADDVDVDAVGQLAVAGGQVRQRDADGTVDVAGRPLVVLADVEDGCAAGDVVHGCVRNVHADSRGGRTATAAGPVSQFGNPPPVRGDCVVRALCRTGSVPDGLRGAYESEARAQLRLEHLARGR